MTVGPIFNAALERQRTGRLAEAERLYRQVLFADPAHSSAAYNLGTIALGAGRAAEAADVLLRASALEPANGVYAANLGEALRRIGRWPEAAQAFAKALYLRPDLAEPAFNLGLLLQDAGELETALSCFEHAAEVSGQNPAIGAHLETVRAIVASRSRSPHPSLIESDILAICALLALADVSRARGRHQDVAALCRRALAKNPQLVPALVHLGDLFAECGMAEEAAAQFRRALDREPGHREARMRLIELLRWQDRLSEIIDALRESAEIKSQPELNSHLLFTLQYAPGYDDATVGEEARAWDRRHAARWGSAREPLANERAPDRRLRIGYVSPSFREHVHMYLLEGLLSNHDHASFEVFLYSDVLRPDGETAHVRQLADGWRDTAALADGALADQIRGDGIDVLIDLAMHTSNNRLLVFARKPAPVQMCWLAYPGTTGLATMDYRVTDPYLDPPDADLSVYSERLLVLPDSFWCYSPRAAGPEISPLPASGRGHITFGCLNNFTKVNLGVLELWVRVLRAVEHSRLVVLAPLGQPPRQVTQLFEKYGIEPGRVTFVEERPRPEYLARYHGIDICLDTFPYAGHTTSLDAFWMGVPVITLAGSTVAGRAGVGMAQNLGLPELIAATADDYVRIAAELARDRPRLAALRAGLRERMERSPLMDGPRFARNMETLYRRAWRAHCERGATAQR